MCQRTKWVYSCRHSIKLPLLLCTPYPLFFHNISKPIVNVPAPCPSCLAALGQAIVFPYHFNAPPAVPYIRQSQPQTCYDPPQQQQQPQRYTPPQLIPGPGSGGALLPVSSAVPTDTRMEWRGGGWHPIVHYHFSDAAPPPAGPPQVYPQLAARPAGIPPNQGWNRAHGLDPGPSPPGPPPPSAFGGMSMNTGGNRGHSNVGDGDGNGNDGSGWGNRAVAAGDGSGWGNAPVVVQSPEPSIQPSPSDVDIIIPVQAPSQAPNQAASQASAQSPSPTQPLSQDPNPSQAQSPPPQAVIASTPPSASSQTGPLTTPSPPSSSTTTPTTTTTTTTTGPPTDILSLPSVDAPLTSPAPSSSSSSPTPTPANAEARNARNESLLGMGTSSLAGLTAANTAANAVIGSDST